MYCCVSGLSLLIAAIVIISVGILVAFYNQETVTVEKSSQLGFLLMFIAFVCLTILLAISYCLLTVAMKKFD